MQVCEVKSFMEVANMSLCHFALVSVLALFPFASAEAFSLIYPDKKSQTFVVRTDLKTGKVQYSNYTGRWIDAKPIEAGTSLEENRLGYLLHRVNWDEGTDDPACCLAYYYEEESGRIYRVPAEEELSERDFDERWYEDPYLAETNDDYYYRFYHGQPRK